MNYNDIWVSFKDGSYSNISSLYKKRDIKSYVLLKL